MKKPQVVILNLTIVIAIAAAVIAFVVFTDFQTTDDYYNDAGAGKENAIGSVTITIRCDAVPDKSAEHIPDDGVILEVTEFEIEEGDTVYDVLINATAKNKLHLETGGGEGSPYVKGINNLYEYDFGDMSGWGYYVNGESPSVGCGEYILSPGDRIEWVYFCGLS